MMSKPGGNFVGAGIKSNGEPSQEEFNAASYSFFGDLGADEGLGGLEGSLEEGLEAPPDEENAAFEAIEPDEDLSLISMFKNQAQLVAGKDDEEGDATTREGLEDAASIDDYLKEVSTLHTKQEQQEHTTPSLSPSKTAAMYGVQLPSSLNPPPFQRQVQLQQMEPMQASKQQQQQQQQPLKVLGQMTAEQLEAQMLGKMQPPHPQPPPRPQRLLDQQLAAEAQQQQQQQQLMMERMQGLGPLPPLPRPGMQGHVLSPHIIPGSGPPVGTGGGPPRGGPAAPPGCLPGMPGMPGGMGRPPIPGMVPPFPLPHMMQPPPLFGPPMSMQQLQQQQMLMMPVATMEQRNAHAMTLQRSGLGVGRLPGSPPHMHHPPPLGQQPPFRPPHSPFPDHQPQQPQQRHLQPFQKTFQGAGVRPPPPSWGNNNHISAGQPVLGGELMSPDELRHIMNIMHAAVHSGVPYVEDYYYQAYVNKHANAANAPAFEPQVLQDLSDSVVQLDPSGGVRFAALDGLGKRMVSNIRTPKVLMDLIPEAGGKEAAGPARPAKPLEQEPLLAARIMIEDCLHLMLDIDDIDRLFTAAAARAAARRDTTAAAGTWASGGVAAATTSLPADAHSLKLKRALLAAGLTSSLRLPDSPDGSNKAAGPAALGGVGDGVLLRILSLAKGRALVARAIGTLLAPPVQYLAEPGMESDQTSRKLPPVAAQGRFENGEFKITAEEEVAGTAAGDAAAHEEAMEVDDEQKHGRPEPAHLLWGVLRVCPKLFSLTGGLSTGGTGRAAALAEEERALLQATHRLAASLCHVLSRMIKPTQLADALAAFMVGLQGPMEAPLPLAHTLEPSAAAPGQQQWLGDVVVALLERAHTLQVGTHPAVGTQWAQGMQGLESVMHNQIQICISRAQSSSNFSAATALCCPPLVTALAAQLPSRRAKSLRTASQPLISSEHA